jgi:hypothetical protein
MAKIFLRSVGDREPRQILDCMKVDQIERCHMTPYRRSHQIVAGLELCYFFLVEQALELMARYSAV